MPDDLRTGLVEAMAEAGYDEGVTWENADELQRIRRRIDARHKLDAALGFLTDNAEALGRQIPEVFLEMQPDKLIPTPRGYVPNLLGPGSVTNAAVIRHAVAALSDNRDTGEKP